MYVNVLHHWLLLLIFDHCDCWSLLSFHPIFRPVWASITCTRIKSGVASSCPLCTTWMTGTSTSTWRPSSGKASGWSSVWVEAGSSTCCRSSLCSPVWCISCCRQRWCNSSTTLIHWWECLPLKATSVLSASQVQTTNVFVLSFYFEQGSTDKSIKYNFEVLEYFYFLLFFLYSSSLPHLFDTFT